MPDTKWVLNREQVAALCAPCGEKMASLHLTELRLGGNDEVPENLKQAILADYLTQPEAQNTSGDFKSYCMRKSLGPGTDEFCSWLQMKLIGNASNAEVVVQANVLTGTRTATIQGKTYRVVPAVLVRSQVLHNNLGRSLLPADALTDDWAELWNGIPVLIGEHPSKRGVAVSGRTPEEWNLREVGRIYNARVVHEGGEKAKLVADIYLDEARAGSVPGFQEVLESVQAGRRVELSTGFSTRTERAASGSQFEGDDYDLIMHPLAPDHLVISTEMTGACSVDDGCGLGAHKKETPVSDKKNLFERVAALFATKNSKMSPEDVEARRVAREVENMAMTDSDKAMALRDALQSEFVKDGTATVVIVDMLSEVKQVVFWYTTPLGAFPSGHEYLMSTWSENEGKFTFTEPKHVRRQTAYEPVASPAAEQTADNRGVAAATNTKPESGKESNMSDKEKGAEGAAGLEQLSASIAALATQVTQLGERFTAIEKTSVPTEIAGLKRTINELSEKFAGFESVSRQAVEERERERQALVKDLAGNAKVPFSAAQLETKPIDELRMLQSMVRGENYEGRGAPAGSPKGEQRFVEPVPYFKAGAKEKE